MNDQIAKELLSKFGDRLTPQFLQALQQSATINQSFQQNQLGLGRTEPEANNKAGKHEGKTDKPAVNPSAQDLRHSERATAEYLARQLAEKNARQASKQQASFKEKAAGDENNSRSTIESMMQENRSRQQEFANPYNPINFNAAKVEAAQRMAQYAAQYQQQQQAANARNQLRNSSTQNMSQNSHHPSYPLSSEGMKSPTVNSPLGNQQPSPAHAQSPANPQLSPAPQHMAQQNSKPSQSPAHMFNSKAPSVSQQYPSGNPEASQLQYSPSNPQASPAHQQYSPANPKASPVPPTQYSPANPQLSPAPPTQYSPANPQLSPAPQQFSPAPNSTVSPVPQQFSPATSQPSPAPNSKQYSPVNSQASPVQQQFSPQQQYSPANQQISPASHQFSQANSMSPAHPQLSPANSHPGSGPQFSPLNPQRSPAPQQFPSSNTQVSPAAHQQFSPNQLPSASPQMSPYSQPSPNLSPYSQHSPKMSPYSQVSPAYPSHQAPLASQQNTQYSTQTSPAISDPIKQSDAACSVPSYLQNKDINVEKSLYADGNKPLSSPAPGSKTSLRSNTGSPRLDTPPGLALPVNNEDNLGRHALPVVTQAVVSRHENAPSAKPVSSKSTSVPSTTISNTGPSPSSFFSSNAISGMASMTNKIKMLESKMQSAKPKSNSEKYGDDNSLKNWWKPLSDVQKKTKSPLPAVLKPELVPLTSEPEHCSKEKKNDFDADRELLRPSLSPPPDNKHIPNKFHNDITSKLVDSPLSPLLLNQENMKLKQVVEPTKQKDCVQPVDQHRPALKLPRHPPPVNTKPPCPEPSPVINRSPKHLTPAVLPLVAASIKDKKPKQSIVRQRKPSLESSSPVPYEAPRSSQRSAESYATPNLERMEIKNSGIPGPSAVTWKRKSIDDAPASSFHQIKKRKLNRGSNDNDIYMFDEEEKSSSIDIGSKDEKASKGPVYKYKSALINRDYDSDSNHSQADKLDKDYDDKKDSPKEGDILLSDRESPGLTKKKNKRPKLEEWSVAKGKSMKTKNDKYHNSKHNSNHNNVEKPNVPSPKEPVLVEPGPKQVVEEKTMLPAVQNSTEDERMPVQKEQPVSANKWYQAFGATETKSKRRQDRSDRRESSRHADKPENKLKETIIKEEIEESKAVSILDIPPEVRRKSRPNFGGLDHFPPDWDRLVKRHHDRCRVPEGLDSSTKLNPKILVGQSTPKKNYEDFARKNMVSPPDMLAMERERMEAKAFTDIVSPKAPNDDLGELPSILETILENRKKLRQATKMGRMYQIPFQKEKKRMMRRLMAKTEEVSVTEDNMGLIPTPGLPLINNDNSETMLTSAGFSSFRSYTLNKYLDYGEQGRPLKTSLWTSEVLDSKTRSRTNASLPNVSWMEIFGAEPSPTKAKGKQQKEVKDIPTICTVKDILEAEPKKKKSKLKKVPTLEPETPPSTPKKNSLKVVYFIQVIFSLFLLYYECIKIRLT